MVPSFFALLDQLPLTSNGKVDRRALRAMMGTQFERIAERVAPRDLLESQLARIWEELLHIEPGVRDNFFELGGHSLAGCAAAGACGTGHWKAVERGGGLHGADD